MDHHRIVRLLENAVKLLRSESPIETKTMRFELVRNPSSEDEEEHEKIFEEEQESELWHYRRGLSADYTDYADFCSGR
jgi:hypothetical protein